MVIPRVRGFVYLYYIHDFVAKMLSHVLGSEFNQKYVTHTIKRHPLWHFLLLFEFKTSSPQAVSFVVV